MMEKGDRTSRRMARPESFKRVLTAACLLAVLAASAAAAQKPKLPEKYRKWLDEEVVYIIAPMEREVFLKLQTDRERDMFIEAFWRQRDPNLGTPENEFRIEHYRRIEDANRRFGRESPRPGWRTDRGRFYIILGEPRDIQRFEGKSHTYDAEVWFYQGRTDLGLPAGFHLVFFRDRGHGEYRLYSPAVDGPQALLAGYLGGADAALAYEKLREYEPGLAAVSLSLIPGEGAEAFGRASLSSDLLIQRIEAAPARSVSSKYAQKFLQYKDVVEVDYTANYLDSDSLVKVFRDASGLYFVHYAIEPRRLSVTEYGGRYATTLKVNGRVTTADGRLVHQYDKTVVLNLTKEELDGIASVPFSFQDLFPLVGGDYAFSVLVKNEASKEFTSLELGLRVPQAGAAVELTQPLLGYRVVRLAPSERKMRAFRIGPFQVSCQPNRVFTRGETLALAFQLNNLSEELAREGEVRIEISKDDQPFRTVRRKPSELADLPDVVEEIPLADFPPAHYKVRVVVAAAGGTEIVSANEEFDLSFAEAVPRPWVSARVLPDAGDPVYTEIMGAQLFNLGRVAEARLLLERALARKPGSEETASSLARACLALGDAQAAVRVLAPFLGAERTPLYETLLLGAEGSKRTGDFARAVELLDRAVDHYGINAVLLNSIGECYEGMGRTAEALSAYEKSLELSPDQPQVRKRVEALRKR